MRNKIKTHANHIYSMRRNRRYLQKHLAVLLGHRCTAMVSEYESGKLLPRLQSALLLEIALGIQLADLYPALYHELQALVIERARRLPPHIRGPLVGRLLGKDLDEHSRQG